MVLNLQYTSMVILTNIQPFYTEHLPLRFEHYRHIQIPRNQKPLFLHAQISHLTIVCHLFVVDTLQYRMALESKFI